MIAIIDYDAGNLKSVEKALLSLGEDVVITRKSHEILQADRVILPGVGNFCDAMQKLHHYQLIDIIKEVAVKNIPFLGICLGLQLLFQRSDECKGAEGLSIMQGEILKIPNRKDFKIPHMGWNSISIRTGSRLFAGIPDQSYVYFVHSYYLKAKYDEDVAATTYYSTLIHASVERGNVFGCQFHPEKSGDVGLQILKNFASI
jgi:glutamine amidotransferase